MTFLRFLITSLLLFAAYSVACGQNQPHIFIINVDDLGWGDLSMHGHPRIHTPHIDTFAKHGRELHFYSGHPVCSPSRVALLTGRVPQAVGIIHTVGDVEPNIDNYELKATEVTLPKVLRSAGYATIHAGKWHITDQFNSTIFNAIGFDYADLMTNNTAWSVFGRARTFIDSSLTLNPNKPIFAYIAPNEPHYPLIDKLPEPYDSFLHIFQYDTISTDAACHLGNTNYADNLPEFADTIKYYYGAVTSLDYAFGNFLDYLDSLGIRDSSIIIFTSDNGPDQTIQSWGTPGCEFTGKKAQVFQGGIRVPGIVQWPGRWDDGTVVTVPTSQMDIYPTLANIAHAYIPNAGQIQGEDVQTIWDQVANMRTKPIYWYFHGATSRKGIYPEYSGFSPQVAYLSADGQHKIVALLECLPDSTLISNTEFLKYAAYSGGKFGTFMYDVIADPSETQDLKYDKPEIFNPLWREFLQFDRQIRHQTPLFYSEDRRAQNRSNCSRCPTDSILSCPPNKAVVIVNATEFIMEDYTNEMNTTYCPTYATSYSQQYPPAGTPLNLGDNIIQVHTYIGNYLRAVCAFHITVELQDKSDTIQNTENCITIGPNPTNNQLHLIPQTPLSAVVLIDVFGRELQTWDITAEKTLQLDFLASGYYYLETYTTDGKFCGIKSFVKY